MDILIVNKGKCKCSMSTMTKYGLDYFCNRCHKPVFDITDDNFMETPDVDLINDLRAELDAEAEVENESIEAYNDHVLEHVLEVANDVKAEQMRGDENI